MIPSERAKLFIKSFEKLRLRVYKPTPKDRWTIGWGTTGPDILGTMKDVTKEWADARFDRDLGDFAMGVEALLEGPPSQAQFDAMCSLAYNIGEAQFATSSVLRYHRLGNYVQAAKSFPLWNKQAGKVLGGLVRRRAQEALMYEGKDFSNG